MTIRLFLVGSIAKSLVIIGMMIALVFGISIISPTAHSTALAQGTNYYVDGINGSDSNAGTSVDHAWRTVQKAADTLVGGDTVYIRGGTYNERVSVYFRGNTNGPYITFINYPNEVTIIDGTGIDIQHGGLFEIEGTNFVRVTGLHILHSNNAGINAVDASHIMIDHNFTYDTVKSGISTWGVADAAIVANDIALACNSHPNYPASNENISIASGSSNIVVKNNYVHLAANIPDGYSGGEGINIKDGSHDVKVFSNIVHLDERTDGQPSNRLAFGLDAWSHETYNVFFYNNIAYNNKTGFVIEAEAGGTAHDIYVYNNLAYNNNYAGFYIPNWAQNETSLKKNILFINNTSYNNEIGLLVNSARVENVVVRNNIFSQNNTQIDVLIEAQAQTVIDHNLYYGPGTPMGSYYIIGDPLFVSPGGSNFHLQNGSPAIDNGSSTDAPIHDFDWLPRPTGAGYDIGAYEFGSHALAAVYLPIVEHKQSGQ